MEPREIIKTHFEHYLSHVYSYGTTAKKISTPTSNTEKWYITAGTGSNAGKYKFINAAYHGTGGTSERYIGMRESDTYNVSTSDAFLEVEVLEAESDYILVRLVGTYPSTAPFNDINKSRTTNQKYYLGEWLKADNSQWNYFNEPWPEYHGNYNGEHYKFGANPLKVDDPRWSGKNTSAWNTSNSHSNYVKYDKYRYTDNKPLGTVLRIEPQGIVP